MTLAMLLREIERSPVPLTSAELGRRLGVAPEQTNAMLAALRAHALLIPDPGAEPPDVCVEAGSCRGSCPGPANCALVGELGLVPLQLAGTHD